VDAIE
jgi:RNA polymerase sigma factor (sigma-70 family)